MLRFLPAGAVRWLYRVALDRGLDEPLLARFVVGPVRATLEAAAAAERRWVEFLGGAPGAVHRGDDGGAP